MATPVHKCNDCGLEKEESSFYKSMPYRCISCHQKRVRKWRKDNPDQARKLSRENQAARLTALKLETIVAYGGSCTCCGESDPHFLTIEHKHGVPDEHKTKKGRRKGSHWMHARLKAEGYPDTYTVLCWNCNASYGYYGFCPHQPHDLAVRRYP